MLKMIAKSWLFRTNSKNDQGARIPRSPLRAQLRLSSLESRVVPCSTGGFQSSFSVPFGGQCGQSDGGFGQAQNHECGGNGFGQGQNFSSFGNGFCQGQFDQGGGHECGSGQGCEVGGSGQGNGGGGSTTQQNPLTISGVVYADNSGTGVYNTSDAVLSGSTVTLTGTDYQGKSVNISVTTGANGAYSFTGVLPGTYTITYTAVPNYVLTEAPGGTPAGAVSGIGSVSNIVATSGQNVTINLPEIPVAVSD
jgi:hypothetical protein